jgi:lipopolysaccharide export system protein LptC
MTLGSHPALQLALRMWQTLWHRAMMYLPIVLIALMALGTWWLARNTVGASAAEPERPVRHEPDYYMRDFAVKNFNAAGLLQSEVAGAQAHHFPDTEVLEIDQARVRSFKQGRVTVATANRAYSNRDGSEVQLVGNAVVVREAGVAANGQAYPRLEIRSEFLHAFLNTEIVKSDQPVVITRDKDRFVADNLNYNNIDRVVQLQGRVKGTLMPRR